MTARCLIIANQTLGGEALDRVVQDCMRRDIRKFHIVAPMTRVKHEATSWTGGLPVPKIAPDPLLGEGGLLPKSARTALHAAETHRHAAELEEARRRAQQRIDFMVDKIVSMGGEATGEVGAEDPLDAARTALDASQSFDEVIVSTLPARLSRWIGMDLPHRIARLTDAPITAVEARD